MIPKRQTRLIEITTIKIPWLDPNMICFTLSNIAIVVIWLTIYITHRGTQYSLFCALMFEIPYAFWHDISHFRSFDVWVKGEEEKWIIRWITKINHKLKNGNEQNRNNNSYTNNNNDGQHQWKRGGGVGWDGMEWNGMKWNGQGDGFKTVEWNEF